MFGKRISRGKGPMAGKVRDPSARKTGRRFASGPPETGRAARTPGLSAMDQIDSVNRAKNILSGWIAGFTGSVS